VDSSALVFSDNDGDNAEGYCNSIQFRPLVLTDDEMAGLGAASPGGIPLSLKVALRITRITRSGTDVVVEWSGGQPPFQVQTKTDLGTPGWLNVGAPTADHTATVSIEPGVKFIRVAGQ
jgi:hypothetical protein